MIFQGGWFLGYNRRIAGLLYYSSVGHVYSSFDVPAKAWIVFFNYWNYFWRINQGLFFGDVTMGSGFRNHQLSCDSLWWQEPSGSSCPIFPAKRSQPSLKKVPIEICMLLKRQGRTEFAAYNNHCLKESTSNLAPIPLTRFPEVKWLLSCYHISFLRLNERYYVFPKKIHYILYCN